MIENVIIIIVTAICLVVIGNAFTVDDSK